MSDVCIVYLPSPPRLNVFRDWAGGYGTALESAREYPGHDHGYFDVPYLQFLYIAQALRDNALDVRYVNLQHHERFVLSDFIADLRQHPPNILLTCVSLPSLEHDLALLRAIRAQVDLKVLLIGAIAKLFKERILLEHYADAIVMEHEEATTPAVVAALSQGQRPLVGAFYAANQAVVGERSGQAMNDLNQVEFPAYDLLDFSRYESAFPFKTTMRYMTLLTSKGCPYPCCYCPYPVGFGKAVMFRRPELVLSDIHKLAHDFGAQLLVFRDQLLTLNRTHCEAICRGMIERKLDVTWICETRYDLVDKPLLRLMREAGCRKINYGLESGDEEIFLAMGKAHAKKGLAYFGQVLQDTKDAGIISHTHLMIGLPDQSWTSIRRTIRFLKTYKPDFLHVAIFIPYPGTPLGNQLAREGRVDNKNLQDYTGFKAVIPTKYLSVEELDEARHYIYHVWNKTLWTRAKGKLAHWLRRDGNYKSTHTPAQ